MLTRYLLPAVALAALGFAVIQMSRAQQKPPPAEPPVEPARSPFPTQLAGSGVVESETENIAIGSALPGLVERVYVKVGDTVHAGDPLFRLDDRQLQAELKIRETNVTSAEANLAKLEAGTRSEELPPAQARVLEAEANLKDQQKLWERAQQMARSKVISDEDFVRREIGVQIAEAQVKRARADLALLDAGTWKYDVAIARATVAQNVAQANQTRTELDRLTVRAPDLPGYEVTVSAVGGEPVTAEGTEFKVLQVNVRPGEYVGTTPGQAMIVLGHVGRLHVRVDIDENDIPRFRPNLPGVAKPRGSTADEFVIHFVRVEPYVIPKKSLTGANTERVDTRVLQVIYSLDPKKRTLYVGQQMDVFLDAGAK